MSTTEISLMLDESRTRAKFRLSRLKRYGLLKHFPIKKGNRTDNYWHPSLVGVYCIFSTLSSDHRRRFVERNKHITDFRVLHEEGDKHNSDIEDLITQINDYVKDGQFHMIEEFVRSWFSNVLGEYTPRSVDISVRHP